MGMCREKGWGAGGADIFLSCKTIKELIERLRHSIAHFSIQVISDDEERPIDWIEFNDAPNYDGGNLVRSEHLKCLTS